MPLHIAQCVWCTFIEHDTSPSSVVHFLADLSMWQCFWLESHIDVLKDKILKNGLKMHSLNTFNAVRLHSVPFNMKCWCHRFQQPIPCAITVSFSFKKIQFHHRVRMLLFLVFFLFFTFRIDHVSTSQCLSCNSACLFSYMRHFCGVEKKMFAIYYEKMTGDVLV